MILPTLDMVVVVHCWLPDQVNLPESILPNQYIPPAVTAD
jgi:hypothetical protein